MSWYRSVYTRKAIVDLVNAGVKTNVHYVLSKSTVKEALARLKVCALDVERETKKMNEAEQKEMEKSLQEAWDSEQFEEFRSHFKKRCPDCKKWGMCMGGCPIVPEIVVCKP